MSQPSIHHASALRVSIVIKALNEELNIRACIESALAAVAEVGGEVILADSLSTDRTVDIAARYPVTIVQLKHAAQRCCGIGPQLGYLFARGEYVYILDGDMRMYPSFLTQAVHHLDRHPELGGVGGRVVELNTDSLEYRERAKRAETGHMQPGQVDRLDMGGLYRRRAIEEVGHFSDRNLHSYEEIDLGLRLRAAGWLLERLDCDAVTHRGHDAPPLQLLRRRWTSRYIRGAGEVLRASLGQRHQRLLLAEMKELRIYAATLIWWLLLPMAMLQQHSPAAALATAGTWLMLPTLAMAAKKRSLLGGCYSTISWTAHAAGTLLGFRQQRTDPSADIECHVLRRTT